MPDPTPDEYGLGCWFKVKLDGAPVAEEGNFREVIGLNVHVDQTIYPEGGKNDGPRILPGPAKYENLILKRGISASKAFFEWVAKYVNKPNKDDRMSGSIALCQRNGDAVMT